MLSGGNLGGGENTLFGSGRLPEDPDAIAAPQFAELGGALKGARSNMLDGSMSQQSSSAGEKRAGATSENEQSNHDERKKDHSHLLQVFNIYRSSENYNESGFFNGGLDTGIEPSMFPVDFEAKDTNLTDRLMTPFPTS